MMVIFCTYFNLPEGTEYNDYIMGYTNNMRMIIEKNMFFLGEIQRCQVNLKDTIRRTVDGRNSAPVDRW